MKIKISQTDFAFTSSLVSSTLFEGIKRGMKLPDKFHIAQSGITLIGGDLEVEQRHIQAIADCLGGYACAILELIKIGESEDAKKDEAEARKAVAIGNKLMDQGRKQGWKFTVVGGAHEGQSTE